MELLITEKETAASNIATILSEGSADVERRNGVNVYKWGGRRCVGLSGHVVENDFPPEYANWRDVEPVELLDADVVVEPHESRENIVRTLRLLARDADGVIIATDYDREGELIGKEAADIVREVSDAPIKRARFSSFAEREVREAFDNLDDLDYDLAAAGEARQEIDLVWGAALTRFLSLTAKQRGNDFISVGRVQSPTLKLIVDRERKIQAFDPETYWELFSDLRKDQTTFEVQYFDREAGRGTDRLWDESVAAEVYDALDEASAATVQEVSRRTRTDDPPSPMNTTQYIRAAGSLGYSAQRAMSLAEELYTAGYITYPRTDNTVYPDDLDIEELLEGFTNHREFGEDAEALLESEEIVPTEGDEETTDHPPIHPTGELPSASELGDDEREIYELVVRRFFATVADPAEWEHLRVTAAIDEHHLKANGKRLVEPGYHAVYPYFNTSENHVPELDEGEELPIEDVRSEEKETQPPRRRGQSRLIERMEQMGIGTKATRHNTIEKLYDRGYIESDPPRPTKLAEAVVEAAEQFADRVVSEEMTSQLETDMAAIADGETGLEDVTQESREMLSTVFDALRDSREEIGEHLRKSLKADKTLGPCPDCGADLLVRKSRHGSSFVGCDGYPDCEFTLPLPSAGEPLILDETCDEHDLRKVKMLDGRSTFVHGCPLCAAEEADAEADRIIGECPECGDEHGGELAIKTLRTGSRLVGCTRYPDCEYSLPLPRRGEIEVTDEFCDEHDLPELVVHSGDEPWELGCPICNYHEYQARQSVGDLVDLDGVGEKTVEKLAAVGIESLDDLRESEADSIAESVQGVSAENVRSWQAKAD
ncbi:DNA topoisomerase I [Halococcus thailandensis]|uniref:DNA topoisomerase 1 n=1 Tax=Halococcus thailandensis JCM 13552 TaxID=1227457 RepID=M0NAJ2_9EURY|nr:DNA topoisomerase I [Halococcus thailandensis]EMA54109.1 DNA topoisomerase I [Halococcus thailandensis JCM 13552]